MVKEPQVHYGATNPALNNGFKYVLVDAHFL